jgi:uncharacterized protein (DUF2141 family)
MSDSACGAPAQICESGQCVLGCMEVGGLTCTGGNTCDPSTGRCMPPQGCASDSACGAPAAICEASACVPGCGMAGGISCGAGTVCDNATGRCRPLAGPCTSDAACGPPNQVCEGGQCVPGCSQVGGLQCSGATQCNNGSGRCDPLPNPTCMDDAQCNAPSTICQNGACVPGCASSGCGTNLTCNMTSGRCETPPPAPMCTRDAFEPNDTQAAARALTAGMTQSGLGACTGEDDFFSFALAAGDRLQIQVDYATAEGDVDISLLNAAGTSVASSASTSGRESVSYTAMTAGTYAIRVYLYRDSGTTPGNTYSIQLTHTPAPPVQMCTNDRFEPNDSQTAATTMSPRREAGLNLCMGNDDFYAISLVPGDQLTVDLAFRDAEGDIDLRLLDPSGASVASSLGTGDAERVTFTALTAGRYAIRAYLYTDDGTSPGNGYDLTTAITVVCPNDRYEENDTASAARTITSGTYASLSSCDLDDDWYKVTLSAGQLLRVNVRFPHAEGDIDLLLFDSGGTSVAGSVSTDDDESLTFTAPTAGTYSIAVFLYAEGGSRPGNMYTLEALY